MLNRGEEMPRPTPEQVSDADAVEEPHTYDNLGLPMVSPAPQAPESEIRRPNSQVNEVSRHLWKRLLIAYHAR